MPASSRTLIGFVAVAGVAIAIALLFTRAPRGTTPVVFTVPAPRESAAGTQPPVVLEEPPVVAREPEPAIAPTEPVTEPSVTRVEPFRVKDSANLGRVHLASPEERAEMEQKIERFLKNQSEVQRAEEPR